MPIVVEKKRRVERTVQLIRPSPSSEVAGLTSYSPDVTYGLFLKKAYKRVTPITC